MTASEPSPSTHPQRDQDARSIAERALDVLVYLPAGALLTALEDVPETVAKGKARVDQELRNAKVVGRFAVGVGWRQLKDQIESVGGERDDSGDGGDVGDGDSNRALSVRSGSQSSPAVRKPGTKSRATTRSAAASRDPEVDHAIPDYDILAASQVVRRLDGLGHGELRAVLRHERATRGRRTILLRAEQLLEGSGSAEGRPAPRTPGSDTA